MAGGYAMLGGIPRYWRFHQLLTHPVPAEAHSEAVSLGKVTQLDQLPQPAKSLGNGQQGQSDSVVTTTERDPVNSSSDATQPINKGRPIER